MRTFTPDWSRAITALCCIMSFIAIFAGGTFCRAVERLVDRKDAVAVTDLRCEYLKNPLGIDCAQPRLSWKLTAMQPGIRGVRQTAYRVLVASSTKMLSEDGGDLWDSGDVSSDQSIHIPYQGEPLESGMGCFWKVKICSQDEVWSGWSEPATWTMGMLQPTDWSAKWIGCDRQFKEVKKLPPTGDYLADPWLRKVISLDEKPTRAVIHVASVGYHELYINGKKVGDTVLAPSVSDHTKRARYVTYDMTDYLTAGRNVIGLWLGASWSVYPLYKSDDKPQTPIVIAQAQVELPDGAIRKLITDESWRTHPSPNVLLGIWNFRNFGGEYYDAAREVPDWCDADMDDSDWKPATVYQPKLMLSAELVEPNRLIKPITPVSVKEVGAGEYRIDMGVNFAGFIEFDMRGEPGAIVELLSSEREEKAMTHKLHSAYRLGPTGRGTFRNRFNYGSGRWIQVKGLTYKPSLKDIRGFMVRSDFERAGWFECSDKLLNDIYNVTLWTFENLCVGGYVVDCPQRERMGYGGDAHATTQTALNNYSLGAFYTKWLGDWRDVQGKASAWGLDDKATNQDKPIEDGNLAYTAPTYWGGGGPAWSGICITMPWYVYRHCGDIRVLEENYNTMQRWLSFLEAKSKNDMLVRWGGTWDFLGDWLWPGAEGVNGDTRETLFFNNCYWVYNLTTAARIADVLGRSEDAAKLRQRADAVRKAIHREFYNPKTKGYVNNLQAYLASALLVKVMPEELQATVWKTFEDEIMVVRKGHFWGGITGGYFIVKNLLEFDRPDLMFEMASKTSYPSWGDLLGRGATTMWEAWDGSNSRLHSSYLHVGAWFIEGLAGIKPDPAKPGYKHFIVKPGVVDSSRLTWVEARYESPYGLIRSAWKIQGDQVHLKVTVPPNTTATVYVPVPAKDAAAIREGNGLAAEAKGVKFSGVRKGCGVMTVGSGDYFFRSKR